MGVGVGTDGSAIDCHLFRVPNCVFTLCLKHRFAVQYTTNRRRHVEQSFFHGFVELWSGFFLFWGRGYDSGGAIVIRWLVAPWGYEIQNNPVLYKGGCNNLSSTTLRPVTDSISSHRSNCFWLIGQTWVAGLDPETKSNSRTPGMRSTRPILKKLSGIPLSSWNR